MGQSYPGNPNQLDCPDGGRMGQDVPNCRFSDFASRLDHFPPFGESPGVAYISPKDASRWSLHEQPDFFRGSAAKAIKVLEYPDGFFWETDSAQKLFPVDKKTRYTRNNKTVYGPLTLHYPNCNDPVKDFFWKPFGFSPDLPLMYEWYSDEIPDRSTGSEGSLLYVLRRLKAYQECKGIDHDTNQWLNFVFYDDICPNLINRVPTCDVKCVWRSGINRSESDYDELSGQSFFAQRTWRIRYFHNPYRTFFTDSRDVACLDDSSILQASIHYHVASLPDPGKYPVPFWYSPSLFSKNNNFEDSLEARDLATYLPPDAEALKEFVKLTGTRIQAVDY